MLHIDEKDLKILDVLKLDSSLSVNRIAKKTMIPITTVHNRITRLRKEGVIKEYTIKIDNSKLGKNIISYILVNIDGAALGRDKVTVEGLARKIRQMDCVEEVIIITGKSDILVRIAVADVNELNEIVTKKLRELDGIEHTSTMIVLKEI